MPTPPKQNGSSTPPKTPGWTQQLFGGFLSSKKEPRVDFSTEATETRISRDRKATPHPNGRRPRTHVDLLSPGYTDMTNGTSSTITTTDTFLSAIDGTHETTETAEASRSGALEAQRTVTFASPAVLDGKQLPTGDAVANISTSLAVLSPWKSTSTNVRFTATVKQAPPTLMNGTSRRSYNMERSPLRHEPLNLQGRIRKKKVMPPSFLSFNKRRHTGRPDVAALSDAVGSVLIGSSGTKRTAAQAQANYQAFKPGNERTRRSRMPPTAEERTADEIAAAAAVVEPIAKRRRVQFNKDEDDAAMTPASRTSDKDDNGRGKRKATPYRVPPESAPDNGDDDDDDKDRSSVPLPEQIETVGGDFRNWSTCSEREVLHSIPPGSYAIPEILFLEMNMPAPGYRIRTGARFREEDITRPEVPFEPDNKKIRVVGKFECTYCHHINDDDETRCLNCGKGRPAVKSAGWGDVFKEQTKKYQCPKCLTLNPGWVSRCQSCDAERVDGKEASSQVAASGDDSGSNSASFSSMAGTPAAAQAPQSQVASGDAPAGHGEIGVKGFTVGGAQTSSSQSKSTSGPEPTTESSGTIGPSGFSFGGPPAPALQLPLTEAAGPDAGSFGTAGIPAGATQMQSSKPASKLSFGVPNFGGSAPVAATAKVGTIAFVSNPPIGNGFVFGATTVEVKKADSAGASLSPTASATASTSRASQQPYSQSGSIFGSNNFGQGASMPSAAPVSNVPATDTSSKRSNAEAVDGTSDRPSSTAKIPETDPLASLVPTHSPNQPSFSFSTGTNNAQAPSNSPFNFGGQNSASSSRTTSATAQPLSSIPSNDGDGSQKKKRRGVDRDDNGHEAPFNKSTENVETGAYFSGGSTKSTSAPLFGLSAPTTAPATAGPAQAQFGLTLPSSASFGSTHDAPDSFGSTPPPMPASSFVPTSAAATAFGSTSVLAGAGAFRCAPAQTAFGSTPAPAHAPFGSAPAQTAFGSTPASAHAPFGSTFGSTPTPAPGPFGSTPAVAPGPFGSTPAPAPAQFGSTPASTPAQFGSTPASTPGPFGSTPAPAPAQFGSTPDLAPAQFGSTPALAPVPFGSTPAPASFVSSATPAPFGAIPAPAPFGSTAASAATFGAAPVQTATLFGGPTAAQTSVLFGSTAAPTQNFGAVLAPAFSVPPADPSGLSSTPAPGPFGQFGGVPAPTAGLFGGGGGFGHQPAASQSQPTAFGGNGFVPAPSTPSVQAGFQIGTGGTSSSSRGTGRGRRIVKARRPRPA